MGAVLLLSIGFFLCLGLFISFMYPIAGDPSRQSKKVDKAPEDLNL